ncbi:unknown [Roseburia sp. CAG:50]|nr:unknown [Roseburia sp. CAG:50]
MCGIRIRADRILTEDKQTADLFGQHLSEALRCLCSFFRVQFCAPCFFKFLQDTRCTQVLITRELIRRSTHIAGTLYVVLTTDRVDPTSRASEVSGDHCQIGERHNALCTGMMLSNTQTVNDCRIFCCRIHSGCLDQFVYVNVTDLSHFFCRIFINNFLHFLEVLGTLLDEFAILKTFGKDNIHHTVCKRYVCTRCQFQMYIGSVCQIDITRIYNDQFRTFMYGTPNLHTKYWMCMLRVGTNKHDQI